MSYSVTEIKTGLANALATIPGLTGLRPATGQHQCSVRLAYVGFNHLQRGDAWWVGDPYFRGVCGCG
jgi:hypothetical protein